MKCKNCGTEMKPSKEIRFECPECGHFGWQPAKTKEQKRDELAEYVFRKLVEREIIPEPKLLAETAVEYAEEFLDRVDKTREEKREKETGEEIQRQSTTESTIEWPEKREKDNRPVTERIRNMNDVLEELGPDHPLVSQYRHYLETTDPGQRDDYLATFMLLRMVTEAINEGWHPEYKENERVYGYVPRIYLLKTLEDAKEYAGYDENVMEIPEAVRCVLFGNTGYSGIGASFAFALTFCASSITISDVASRLCFKTEELAMHAEKTFPELWMKFYFM